MDETRMMSSNPEGMSQFEDLVRRDRNHPSVFLWSLGNEEPTATNAKGANIVTAMQLAAKRCDGSRPTTVDGMINGEAAGSGTGALAVCDVIGYHTPTRRPKRSTRRTQTAGAGHRDRERGVYARHLHYRQIEGVREFLRSLHDIGARLR